MTARTDNQPTAHSLTPRRKFIFRGTLLVVPLILALLCSAYPAMAQIPADGPQVWIEFPLDGQMMPLQEPVPFVVYATDAQGITQITLRVNGEDLPASHIEALSADGSQRTVFLDQEWVTDQQGEYIVEARGRNSAGTYGEPAYVKFCVGSCEPVRTPTAIALPSSTNTPFMTVTNTPRPLIAPTNTMWAPLVSGTATPTPAPALMVVSTTTPTPVSQPVYNLYVRRMDYAPPNPTVGDGIQMAVMIATDYAPQGAPYFPASHFRWRQGPTFPWNEEACPDNTQYASCLKTIVFTYNQPGSYVVEVQADSHGEVAETDETDNTKTWTIAVGQPQPVTLTPIPYQQPVATSINFRSDTPYVNAGNCTTLRWDVDGVQAVYLNGQGVTGHEARQVCPCEPTTYRLEVVKNDGSRESRDVFIDVYGTCQAEPPPGPGEDIYPPDYPSSDSTSPDTSGPDISGLGVRWEGCRLYGYATIGDASGVSWAQFHFSIDGNAHSLWMADRGGYWETEAGGQAPGINGTIDYYVIASDTNGNQNESGSHSESFTCGVNY